ncbi:hypothetical protein OHB26_39260 (plasmid) [Nocardia sp. NBC_01503]|uniref:hypothetical protein n=1 Tax=Nocardia sp. NBC_01503 TaxID=2975997 RepID=UPI002E7B1D06|nr:hypothetical protein [Nocardia sp. NBC_01503]WTL36718.1 hypothetical protein OHB26_39260 [Nocardia sp. NBC_01503]
MSLLRRGKKVATVVRPAQEMHRRLAYHALTDDWRYDPWDCRDPGALTPAEALKVHKSHGPGKCETADCRIFRTARRILARQIDQETQPLKTVDLPTVTFAPYKG